MTNEWALALASTDTQVHARVEKTLRGFELTARKQAVIVERYSSTVVQMGSSQDTIDRASRLVGTMIRDKWRLDAVIGLGGMAIVYAATHRNGKRAAIKLLNRELSEDDQTRARFLREGYVANKVGHPGVVSVLDDDMSEDGRAFLVMELLEGETLKVRWTREQKRIVVDEVLRIAYAVLDVLAAAHDKGIVHRDIKPDNIFLTNDGIVKVLDFGIARLREFGESADATRSSAMLGTPAFMAPEQARSRWEWVDARTDIWAVGATMFTSLTGHFVHHAMTVTELLVTAATMPARPIRSLMPELSEGVAAIIDRAIAYEQGQRWPDARAMQAAIGFALQSIGSAAPGVQTPQPQAATNQTPTQSHSVAVASGSTIATAPQSQPAMPSRSESLGRKVPEVTQLVPMAPISNPKTAPFPDQRLAAVFDATPSAQVVPAPRPSAPASAAPLPPPAPVFQPNPAPISQPATFSNFANSQPAAALSQSQPGLMRTPMPGVISQPGSAPEAPGVSTLVAAATASATLTAAPGKRKTNPFVFPAIGGIFVLGLIAAFFIVRSSGNTDKKETNAGTPPPAASNMPRASTTASVAPIVEPASPVVEPSNPVDEPASPMASDLPAASPPATTANTSQPRQTETTKPRTTPTVTKKRDPFDKY